MSITVIAQGVLTTVQDFGRHGLMQFGIGETGAMDRAAYRAANYLVGNENGEAVLEATFMGPTLRFDAPCVCALTGADMQAKLDGVPVPLYQSFAVQAGQTLAMAFAVSGCRGYLAVAGGIDVPVVMGSRSTDLKCKIGGFEGRALAKGDVVQLGAPAGSAEARTLPRVTYADNVEIRVVAGLQLELFTAQGVADFFSEEYTLTPQSDRMGMRLDGKAVETLHGSDIISDGIAFGSIQIPTNGKPIILLADHQTTGGYAKIGAVASVDLPKLAQLKPGAKIRFKRVSIEEAEELALQA